MALFDTDKVMYLSFYILLTDRDRVAELQALYPGGVNRAPYNPSVDGTGVPGGAAVEFEAPFIGASLPKYAQAPCTYTPWAVSPSGEAFPTNVATFQQHTGGFWGIGGTTTRYYWMGQFLFNEVVPTDATGAVVAAPADIAKRHWVEGFEAPGLGPSGHVGNNGLVYSRDASRHVGGLGLAYRGTTSSATISATVYDAGLVAVRFWQRGYVRLRRKPGTGCPIFWRCNGYPSAGVGFALGMMPTGQIALFGSDSASTLTLLATTLALEEWSGLPSDDAWVKLDILVDYSVSQAHLYVRGDLAASGVQAATGTKTQSTQLGNAPGVANDLGLDLDDWHQAEWPATLDGNDFLSGSSIRLVRPTAYSTHHDGAAWTGDFRLLRQFAAPLGVAPVEVTSSTAQAILAVDTDSALVIDEEANAIGVAAMVVSAYTKRGTTNGLLGYALNGAAADMVTIVETGSLAAHSVLFTVPGTSPTLPDVTPIELLYLKGNDASAGSIAALVGQVELIGKFGAGDYFATALTGISDPVLPPVGQHNAPYPRSPWAVQSFAPPISPYFVTGGTYVGNGTGQDLNFPAPVHWLLIRSVSPVYGPFFWVSAELLSHKLWEIGMDGKIVGAEEDPDYDPPAGTNAQQQQYRVRLAGNSAYLNANGVTYQYIAVGDPGMRYMLNLQLSEFNTRPLTVTPLVDPGYLPEWAFVLPEVAASTSTKALYAKGPGQATATIAKFDTAALASALEFGTGAITTRAALHGLTTTGPITLSLWRRHDGQADTDEASVVNIGTYVGDGSASRTINLAPTCGRRPLFAIVFSENAGGFYRDPSHTAALSANNAGADTANGITGGGIDQFSVGATLNGSTVRYIYFVLYADATAGNGGWGVNGTIWPVEPTWPGGGWPGVPIPPVETPPVVPPVVIPPGGITTDLAAACLAYSTMIVNLALSRIGVSKALVSLADDITEEAYTSRLHYGMDVGRVLRDFPWPFATRYANLVLVAGTDTVPVNGDWQYAYRAPTNMVFARRIVGQAQQRRAYDPDPIPFRLGSDATGDLIYCNEPATEDVPLSLEYTIRVDCPASAGDYLFRSALAWRHAASLVAPLARDVKLIQYCESMYRMELARAAAAAAREQQQDPDGDASWISGRN